MIYRIKWNGICKAKSQEMEKGENEKQNGCEGYCHQNIVHSGMMRQKWR